MDKIYFDNAATTPIHPDVVHTMHQVMLNHFGNPSSIHAYGRTSRTLIEKSRKTVADILNASSGEIFFTSSATESNNMALLRSVIDLGVTRIISSPTEHPCVLNSLKAIKELYPSTEILYLDTCTKGHVDLSQLETMLKASTDKTLVSLMHGNNEVGTMLNLQAVSNICEQHEALFHCDTVQTIGKFDIDLQKLNVSFLSGSGHKIYGPKGIGMIYINSNNMIKAMINGGGQERQLRSGTENIYGIVGFAKALELLYNHKEDHNNKLLELRSYFKDKSQSELSNVLFNGDQESSYLPHILNMSIPKTDKTDLIMFNLDIHGICASAGSACSSGSERDSHVLQAINSPEDRKAIRFSFSTINTKDEIDMVIDKMKEIL